MQGIAARAEQSLGSGGKGDRGGDGGAPPASAAEFERRWRALKGDAAGRLAFAALLPEGAWAELFKVCALVHTCCLDETDAVSVCVVDRCSQSVAWSGRRFSVLDPHRT